MTDESKPEQNIVDVAFQIKLTLRAPILTRSSVAAGFGMDAPAARNHHGRLYLPDTLIKGCLLESLQDIGADVGVDETTRKRWFGEGSQEGSYDASKRGILEFSDLETEAEEDGDIGYRIRIDDERGAVDSGALQIFEMPFKPGREIPFSGTIRAVASSEEIEKIRAALMPGFRWIPAMGGERGVGFGEVIAVDVKKISETPPPSPLTESATAMAFAIRPLEPFCISIHTPIGNLFDSESTISGAVIKGTIANTLNRWMGREPEAPLDGSLPPPWTELGKHFHSIRISHAFPAERQSGGALNPNARPVYPPLSTVTCGHRIYDVALKQGPGIIRREDGAKLSPTFKADWKSEDEERVWKAFRWPEQIDSERDMRVHTAMEKTTRRAKDEALFAVRRIIPDGMEWIGHFEIRFEENAVSEEEQKAVASQLKAILQGGLIGLGKTKVRAEVTLDNGVPPGSESTDPIVDKNGTRLWIVALQTPAVMADPQKLVPDAASRKLQMQAAYGAYWDEISESSLELSHYFAHQSMKGRYLFYHFQKQRQSGYYPFFLTESGSVFVLRETGKGAQSYIDDWRGHGLPLPEWAKTAYGEHWHECPWLKGNGFGEIAVNLDEHIQNCPDDSEWEEVR